MLEIQVMTRVCTKLLLGGVTAIILSACQVQKTANPLSPNVAGPVEGVVISTPYLLEPGQDWELKTRDQPIKLMFQNAASNGARPLKYSFDIATDSAFKNIVFARTGIEPSAGSSTTFQLPDKLAAGTYWWRTRADDGANSGAYSDDEKLPGARRSHSFAAGAVVAVERIHGLRPDARVQNQGRQSQRRDGRSRLHAAGGEQLVVHIDRGNVHAG